MQSTSTSPKIEPLSPTAVSVSVSPADEDLIDDSLPDVVPLVKYINDDSYSIFDDKLDLSFDPLPEVDHLITIEDFIKQGSPYFENKLPAELNECAEYAFQTNPFVHYDPKSPATVNLLNEFETVYNVVGISNEALTPPQTPPRTEELFASGQYVQTPFCTSDLSLSSLSGLGLAPATPCSTFARELAAVDELVRNVAEELKCSPEPPECAHGDISMSPTSLSSDQSSLVSKGVFEEQDWMPSYQHSINQKLLNVDIGRKSIRRSPLATSDTQPKLSDKKSKKKEQNKNAATRYRMKKRAEIEEILEEEKRLLEDNEKLKQKIMEIQKEKKYLVTLMRDLFKTKGLI